MTPELEPSIQCSGFVMVADPNDDAIRIQLQAFGVWESHATNMVLEKFRGGTFVDVGAHWGYYSMLLARQVDRVFAIEANPFTFKYLVETVKRNGFTNVIPINMAGWNEKAKLWAGESHGNTGGAKAEGQRPNGDWNVWGERLDTIFRPNEVQFMKIDCEGADSRVLEGSIHILTEGSPQILIESPGTDLMNGLGYKPIFYSNNNGQGPTYLWSK